VKVDACGVFLAIYLCGFKDIKIATALLLFLVMSYVAVFVGHRVGA
jgi:hypothetical protein